jgi:hypothetical protein
MSEAKKQRIINCLSLAFSFASNYNSFSPITHTTLQACSVTMATIHNSSNQMSNSVGSVSTPDSDGPEQTNNETLDPISDSTHLSNEATHEKSDQQLEATDPDISTNSSESPSIDQVTDSIGTPLNSEIQEEEYVSSDSGAGRMLATQEETPYPESKAHSIRLAGHNKEVSEQSKHHHDYSDFEHRHHHDHDQNATTSAPKDTESNTAETNRSSHNQHLSMNMEGIQDLEELDSTKHAKRTVDDQAKERHDYLAGAYKSPFRHAHKVEKVGREEL